MNEADFVAILRALVEHRVDFIVVGGVAAVLQGAPVATFDLEAVHARTEQNIARLLAALDALDAYYRTQPEKRLRPGASQLASAGHQLLMTRFGPLDLLGTIGRSRTYEDLLGHAGELAVAEGILVRVLDLETIDPYRDCPGGVRLEWQVRVRAGAVSIGPFELEPLASAADAAPMGFGWGLGAADVVG